MPLNVRQFFREHRDAFVLRGLCHRAPTAQLLPLSRRSQTQEARWDGALSSLQLYGEVVPHVGGEIRGGALSAAVVLADSTV